MPTILDSLLLQEFQSTLSKAKGRVLRTFRQFVSDLVIPEGPYTDFQYSVDYQPLQGSVLDLFDSNSYCRHVGTGCIQSGKTFLYLVIPCLYHLFELKERVILFAPNMDTCIDKYNREILPVIDRSPELRRYLPRRGKGSRGGTANEIEFANGIPLKFMTPGGSLWGYTSRVVCITEADEMDEARESSRQADPVTQAEARTLSFGDRRRIYIESITTNTSGRIHNEWEAGTAGEFYSKCPHCRQYVCPDRKAIHYDNTATTSKSIAKSACWICPYCAKTWTPKQRENMIQNLKLVFRGQTISKDGIIKGQPPDVDTCSVKWNAFANAFWETGLIATAEAEAREAAQLELPSQFDLEKRQCQYFWTTPYEDPDWGLGKLDPQAVRRRVAEWEREVLPEDTDAVSVGIDLGKSTCWWVMMAGRKNGSPHIPAYGAFTACSDTSDSVELALMNSLAVFKETLIDPGVRIKGSEQRRAIDVVFIDGIWQNDTVARFVRSTGSWRESGFRMAFGRGSSMMRPTKYNSPQRKDKQTRWIGDHWYGKINASRGVVEVTFDSDFWKLWLQTRLTCGSDKPGGLTFYKTIGPDPNHHEHAKISNHFTNEKLVYKQVEGKGVVQTWEKHGKNHWLDAGAMAAAGLSSYGWKVDITAEVSSDESRFYSTGKNKRQDVKSWWSNQARRGNGARNSILLS